jgi:hypothetical protein
MDYTLSIAGLFFTICGDPVKDAEYLHLMRECVGRRTCKDLIFDDVAAWLWPNWEIFPVSIDTPHNSLFALSRFSRFLPGAALTQGSRPFDVPETEAGVIPSMSRT